MLLALQFFHNAEHLVQGAKRLQRCTNVARVAWFSCLILLLISQMCSAANVEIVIGGRISVDDPLTLLPDSIQTGERWTGRIRYQTDFVDRDPDPVHGEYFDTGRSEGLSISVNVHGHLFAGGDGALRGDVINDAVFVPGQVFQFPPGDSLGIGGPMFASPRLLDQSSIFFAWHDRSGVALATDALPANFNPFDFVQSAVAATSLPTFSPIYIAIQDFGLSTPNSTAYYSVIASIEFADVNVTPEPAVLKLSLVVIYAAFSQRTVSRRLRR